MEEKKPLNVNNVHIYGDIASVTELEQRNGTTKFLLKVRTVESYLKAEGLDPNESSNYNRKNTYHDVSIICGKDKADMVEKLRAIGKGCSENKLHWDKEANAWEEGYTPSGVVKISLDGRLASYKSTCLDSAGKPVQILDENGKAETLSYDKSQITASPDNVIIGRGDKMEKEARNTVEISGFINQMFPHSGKTNDGKEVKSVTLIIGTPFAVSVLVDKDGKKEKQFKDIYANIEVRVTDKNVKEGESLYTQIMNGSVKVGDKILAKGILHNNNYTKTVTDATGAKVEVPIFKMIADASKVEYLGVSKKQGEAQEAEAKPEPKPEKKAAPKRARQQKVL